MPQAYFPSGYANGIRGGPGESSDRIIARDAHRVTREPTVLSVERGSSNVQRSTMNGLWAGIKNRPDISSGRFPWRRERESNPTREARRRGTRCTGSRGVCFVEQEADMLVIQAEQRDRRHVAAFCHQVGHQEGKRRHRAVAAKSTPSGAVVVTRWNLSPGSAVPQAV